MKSYLEYITSSCRYCYIFFLASKEYIAVSEYSLLTGHVGASHHIGEAGLVVRIRVTQLLPYRYRGAEPANRTHQVLCFTSLGNWHGICPCPTYHSIATFTNVYFLAKNIFALKCQIFFLKAGCKTPNTYLYALCRLDGLG